MPKDGVRTADASLASSRTQVNHRPHPDCRMTPAKSADGSSRSRAKVKEPEKRAAPRRAKGRSQTMPAANPESETCFTIMPFGGWFDRYYSDLYVPAIEASGLIAHRADDLYRPSAIVHDIWSYTKQSRVVLADLTGKNPNVFYELGLAHALAKPVILVAQSIDDVPFDLRALRVIQYDKNAPDWGQVLMERITTAIKEVLNSPESAVLPAFLNVSDASVVPTVTADEKQLLELRQDLALLRQEVRRGNLRSTRHLDDMLAPGEARQLIAEYLGRGYPNSLIEDMLRSRGVPLDWLRRVLRERQPELPLSTAEPPSVEFGSDTVQSVT